MKFITDTGIEITAEFLSDTDKKYEKLTLIDDIIRVKKMLFGFGYTQHSEFLKDETAVKLFDELYELDVEALRLVCGGYEKQVNEHLSLIK
jgi:hypothetical protein